MYLIAPDDDRSLPSDFPHVDMYVRPCFTPFYLTIVRWSIAASGSARLTVDWAFDVCYDRANCRRQVGMENYFEMENRGIDVVIQGMLTAPSNFAGELISIVPFSRIHMDWKRWKELLVVPLRHVQPDYRMMFYVGYKFETLTRAHNLTFKTVPFDELSPLLQKCDRKFIELGLRLRCELDGRCESLCASLMWNSEYRTLMSLELLAPSPYNLSSLGMPMTPLLACITLSAVAFVWLLLGMSKPTLVKQWPIPRALRYHSSFASFRFCPATRSKFLHILWVWTTSLFLVVYASFLQSSVVAPETQPAELSFDELVYLNYTFVSADYKFIQISGHLPMRLCNN